MFRNVVSKDFVKFSMQEYRLSLVFFLVPYLLKLVDDLHWLASLHSFLLHLPSKYWSLQKKLKFEGSDCCSFMWDLYRSL